MNRNWRYGAFLSLSLVALAASGCVSEADESLEDAPVAEAESPITAAIAGAVEAIDPQGIVRGWAKDPADPTSVYIRVLSDGVFVASCSAALTRPDGGWYGFACHLPASVGDGQPHQLQVQALNSAALSTLSGVTPAILYDQPVTLSYRAPFGAVESFDHSTGVIQGWALDLDTPAAPVTVTASVTLGFWGWEVPIATTTSILRSDINAAYGVQGNHGFVLQIPAQYKGKTVSVRVDDSSGNGALQTKLLNSGQVF